MTAQVHTYMINCYLFQMKWTGKSWRVRVFNTKHRCVGARVFKRKEAAHMYIDRWRK